LAFLFVIFSMMQPVKELGNVNNRIQEAIAAGKRLFNILDLESEVVRSSGLPAEVHIGRVESFLDRIIFQNVSFQYVKNKPVLRNINLTVPKGQILAIVGPSGVGKSTLVDLIPRFIEPEGGRIFLDGCNLREIELYSLRKLMGIVTQETILFHDTVRRNIAYGLSDVPHEKIEKAARAANAHDFITQLPDGYSTIIGERGVMLSGGQRQRLAIARALLKNPPILILDEATSALDTESELQVQGAIENLMSSRTVFVIAHRLSTVQNADQIIVLENGAIVQKGKHQELIQQEGPYKKLYNMQFHVQEMMLDREVLQNVSQS
jgi:subfamily B ATP-binding cassette protein MsbA